MDKAEFSRLKEDANKFLQITGEYQKAIEVFDQILGFSGLESESKAVIFASRSAANLDVKTQSSLEAAKSDAESAIQEWPRWWKGYFSLSRVQSQNEMWIEAEKSLQKALKYNPKSKEALKQLGIVKTEICKLANEMNNNTLLKLFQELSFGEWKKKNNPLNFEQFGKAVMDAAAHGSLTAKRHLDIWKNLGLACDAFKQNDSDNFIAALSKAIHINHEIVDIPEAFKPLITERFKTHPDDLDTAVCYICINTKNREMLKIAQEFNGMFPDDEYLWEMVIAGWITFKQHPSEALRVSKKAIKNRPDSLSLLYSHAIVLCFQEYEAEESVKALNNFLAKASKDHPKVPACYYRKAEHFSLVGNRLMFVSSFKAGLAAEKNQLSCFLPYEYEGKEMLQMAFKAFQRGRGGR